MMNLAVLLMYLMVPLIHSKWAMRSSPVKQGANCGSCSQQQSTQFGLSNWSQWTAVAYDQACTCESGSRLRRFEKYLTDLTGDSLKYFCCPTSGGDACYKDNWLSNYATQSVTDCESQQAETTKMDYPETTKNVYTETTRMDYIETTEDNCGLCSQQQGTQFGFSDWSEWTTVAYDQACTCESGSRLRRFEKYLTDLTGDSVKYFCCPTSGEDICYQDDWLSNHATQSVTDCESQQVESVDVVVKVEGVTDSNKDLVCDGFAQAVGGTVSYCSLSGPNTKRRRLTINLYMDIIVPDATAAIATMKKEKFVETVTLPSEVKATTLTAKKTSTPDAKVCPPNSIKKSGVCYCKFDRTLLASDSNCPQSSPVKSATTQQAINTSVMAVLLLLGLLI